MAKGRVLVTGGAGFIGTHTCAALLEQGYAVRVLDALLPPVHVEHKRPADLLDEVELMVGDVRSRDDMLKALQDVEAVIHLAAYQDYNPDFSTFFAVNTVGTALLYEIAVERSLPLRKVVVASSQAVYGEAAYLCAEHDVVMPPPRTEVQLAAGSWDVVCPLCAGPLEVVETDEERVHPHNSYALSKHALEALATTLGRRYGIPTTCLRYSIVQGPGQSFHNAYSGICRVFSLRLLGGKRPVAFEDGRQLRDYVWIGDVVAANLLTLEDGRSDFHVYNVGGAERCTVAEFGAVVAHAVGRPELTPETPGLFRFGDTRHVISSSRQLRELGWQQTLRTPEVISRYLEWAAAQPDARDNFDVALARMLESGAVRRAASGPCLGRRDE